MAQEGLRNIWRHAGATDVHIELRRMEGAVRMEIRDTGRGFDRGAADWRPGLGLASMEERVRLLGGSLKVNSRPGGGTRILVEVPTHGQTEDTAGG
ncbi:MAG: ATP-binding protein [Bryobacteraceae bacterium]|nr:ATP-binding protein [Bryobacteraceae bacterium]